jgi:LmbE family N-acetylglucosaminyl deacetylase
VIQDIRAGERDLLRDVRPGDRWLVAVAHPDDETFGCGSVIARAASLGAEGTVACATRGEAGEPTPGCTGDLGAVREAELRRAAARLGATRVELLGYRDSGFDGEPPQGSLCAAPVAAVAGVLERLLTELQPGVVVVLDGSDGHRDHRHVRAAVHAALGTTPAADQQGAPQVYEHCLPNTLMRRWLEEMRKIRPGTAYHSLDPADLGRPDADVTDVVDGSAVLDVREAAMAEHRSQASPFDGLSDDLRRAFLTVDHLVRVVPGRRRSPAGGRKGTRREDRPRPPRPPASVPRPEHSRGADRSSIVATGSSTSSPGNPVRRSPMSASDVHRAISSPPIPRPRAAERDAAGTTGPVPVRPEFPWPEPWRSAPGAHPRTEYWDVTTAGWHSRGPRRPGD